MTMPNHVVRLEVVINKNGRPKQVLKDVRSVLEISNEETETISKLSFCNAESKDRCRWHDFGPDDFDRITIEKRRGE